MNFFTDLNKNFVLVTKLRQRHFKLMYGIAQQIRYICVTSNVAIQARDRVL